MTNTQNKFPIQASFSFDGNSKVNPWTSKEIDKLEFDTKDFNKIVEACRFFYKKDPIASSTINKLVEIGINDLLFSKNGLSANEFRIFTSLREELILFAENMALEFLISGLVVPEIKFSRVNKTKLEEYGIKKYESLILPTSMWLRNPADIVIKPTVLSSTPSYFYKVPEQVVYFIKNEGKYPDGSTDKKLWEELLRDYGQFISQILSGTREFLISGDLIFRRKPLVNDPYPIPYLFAALENLKHKRNLRRMDYSIASRVIGAIQLFKLGDKDFPVTEENQESQFGAIQQQMYYRESPSLDIERIFQLFANHTLQIEWVYPDTTALLNEQKYDSINQDIIYALGFPRILITGEAERTGTSDPQYAMMSPTKTMDAFRRYILQVLKYIVRQIAVQNNLKTEPIIKFKPLRLFDYQTLLKSLADLYVGGNLSRTTYADELGYSWDDETEKREVEKKTLVEKGLDEIAPQPFSKTQEPKSSKPSDIGNNSNNKNGEN